jgi:methionine-rich copper-binding protein CopC
LNYHFGKKKEGMKKMKKIFWILSMLFMIFTLIDVYAHPSIQNTKAESSEGVQSVEIHPYMSNIQFSKEIEKKYGEINNEEISSDEVEDLVRRTFNNQYK